MTQKGTFKIDVYDCCVVIIISDNVKQSINSHLREHDDSIDFDVTGYCWRPSKSVSKYYVFFDKESLDVNTYNHEKSHLVEFVLEDRSIKPKDEVRSYLDGFISKKMNQFFDRRKIKLK